MKQEQIVANISDSAFRVYSLLWARSLSDDMLTHRREGLLVSDYDEAKIADLLHQEKKLTTACVNELIDVKWVERADEGFVLGEVVQGKHQLKSQTVAAETSDLWKELQPKKTLPRSRGPRRKAKKPERKSEGKIFADRFIGLYEECYSEQPDIFLDSGSINIKYMKYCTRLVEWWGGLSQALGILEHTFDNRLEIEGFLEVKRLELGVLSKKETAASLSAFKEFNVWQTKKDRKITTANRTNDGLAVEDWEPNTSLEF